MYQVLDVIVIIVHVHLPSTLTNSKHLELVGRVSVHAGQALMNHIPLIPAPFGLRELYPVPRNFYDVFCQYRWCN